MKTKLLLTITAALLTAGTAVADSHLTGLTFNLVPNGDFEDADDELTWDSAGGAGAIFTYPDTEGNPGGYATIAGQGTWAVLVSAKAGGAAGGGIPVEKLGVTGGMDVEFRYDSVNTGGAGNVGGMKVEAWAKNAVLGNSGEIRPVVIGDGSTWQTYSFNWTLPAGTEKLIFVPLWDATGSTVGFDNIGLMGGAVHSELVPNGDFEDFDDSLTWDTASGAGAEFAFPHVGGNPAGFATITGQGTWAVLVSATTGGANGGGIPIEQLGVAAGQTVTFRYDSINTNGPGNVGGIKVEAWAANAPLGNSGEFRPTVIGDGSTWETYAFRWKVPAGTEKLIFVPLWDPSGGTVGFDNVGVMPPVAYTGTHVWGFEGPAGETIDQAPNDGTKGGVRFQGGSPDWTTNGAGSLLIKSDSGEGLVQSNANMGQIAGTFSIQYDMSWNFATAVSGGNREMFLISRTSSGANPAGNQFRFSLTIYSGTSVLNLASQAAGIPGGSNYNNPVPLADLTTEPQGSVSLKVTYSWNETNTTLQSIACEYSMDAGQTWVAYDHDLGDAFVPYAITDLGDLRIHSKGSYGQDNYFAVDAVVVTGGQYPVATSWAGYPLVDGYADTEGWIGWVYPDEDFVYLISLPGWTYMPESFVGPGGSWTYSFK